jgi:RNA recognition motif-containing protein
MKLYVSNLGYEVTQDEVVELFRKWKPRDVYLGFNDRGPRGFGFINVADEVAEHCISEMNGTVFSNRRIVVTPARNQKGKP